MSHHSYSIRVYTYICVYLYLCLPISVSTYICVYLYKCYVPGIHSSVQMDSLVLCYILSFRCIYFRGLHSFTNQSTLHFNVNSWEYIPLHLHKFGQVCCIYILCVCGIVHTFVYRWKETIWNQISVLYRRVESTPLYSYAFR